MPVVSRSKVMPPENAPTRKFIRSWCLVLFAVMIAIPAGYLLIPSVRNPSPEALTREIGQIEAAIRDNGILMNKLDAHANRLKSVAGDSQLYRLPVLIQGRSTYITLTAAELDEFSQALALEDLLIRHRVTKGHFQSSSVDEWKAVLAKGSDESRDHLEKTELLAVQNRMDEIQQETSKLEARLSILLQKVARASR